MKITKGFISNSSSSSFIIALEEDKLETWDVLKEFLSVQCEAENVDQIDQYAKKEYSWPDDNRTGKEIAEEVFYSYDIICDVINNGNKIAFIDVDYCDEVSKEMVFKFNVIDDN